MGRKVLQGLAANICQIFLGYQCYEDLPGLERLGKGRYDIDILTMMCNKDGIEIDSLTIAGKLQQWFFTQLGKENIPLEEIQRAVHTINLTDVRMVPYSLLLREHGLWSRRNKRTEFKLTNFKFECVSHINAYGREYTAQDFGQRELG